MHIQTRQACVEMYSLTYVVDVLSELTLLFVSNPLCASWNYNFLEICPSVYSIRGVACRTHVRRCFHIDLRIKKKKKKKKKLDFIREIAIMNL